MVRMAPSAVSVFVASSVRCKTCSVGPWIRHSGSSSWNFVTGRPWTNAETNNLNIDFVQRIRDACKLWPAIRSCQRVQEPSHIRDGNLQGAVAIPQFTHVPIGLTLPRQVYKVSTDLKSRRLDQQRRQEGPRLNACPTECISTDTFNPSLTLRRLLHPEDHFSPTSTTLSIAGGDFDLLTRDSPKGVFSDSRNALTFSRRRE